MPEIKLEYRLAIDHVGRGKITTPNVPVQKVVPVWSYAKHLPSDWDQTKSYKRIEVVWQLAANLEKNHPNYPMDLSPLKNDQRVAGSVAGRNPLQNMYNIIEEIAQTYPDYEFFGKWGGYKINKLSKRFVFYVEDENDAELMLERVQTIAENQNVPLIAEHQYGLRRYQKFVNIDSQLKSKVRHRDEFKKLLEDLTFVEHFAHGLFLDE
jgi:hypothetical protein